jgi:hypothetical protein
LRKPLLGLPRPKLKYSMELGYRDDTTYYLCVMVIKTTTILIYNSYSLWRNLGKHPSGALFCRFEHAWPPKGVTDPTENIEARFVMVYVPDNDNARIRLI